LGWTRKAIKDVTGVTPLLFRPPYGDIDDRVRAIAKAMNLIPALWTSIPDDNELFDSNDWRVHGGQVQPVANQQTFYATLAKSQNLTTGFVVLQHDIYSESVDIAIGATIPDALAHNPPFNMQSVQVCQGAPIGNAYLETTGVSLPNSGNNNATQSSTTTRTSRGSSSSSSSSTLPSSNSATPAAKPSGAAPLSIGLVAPLVTLGALALGSLTSLML